MEMQGFHLRTSRKQSERSTFRRSPRCVKLSRRYFGQSAIMRFFRNRSAFGMKCNSFSAESEKQLRKV